jgi:folate-binding protein YgfZ
MAREFARIRTQRLPETRGKTMLKSLTKDFSPTPLAELGAVRVQGADNLRFLQGQLSNDTQKVTQASSILAGLHTPQGRAIALLRLIAVGPEDVLAVLPRDLAAPVAARLSKYVLRAKAKVTDVSGEWQFYGLALAESSEGEPAATTASLPTVVNAQAQYDSAFVVRISDEPARWLVATRSNASPLPVRAADDAESGQSFAGTTEVNQREQWRAFDIAAGIPQVYAQTTEAFVAQMLNLDALGAIAFDKGCYTGQEIIARAHYRGRIKRRMQRFRTLGPARLAIGDSGKLRDGRSFRVVEAVQLHDGRCEFLAIAPTGGGEEEAPGLASPASAAATIDAEQLPLPYALPE